MDNNNDVDSWTEINGIPIEQIEKRGRPIGDNTTDAEWRYRSFDGFIGKGESFKALLKNDRQKCIDLGFSHTQLAQELKNILFTTEETRARKDYGMMKPISIQFSSNLFPNTQTLKVSRQIFNGPQYSLFWNDSRKDSIWNTQWNEEYVILNERLGLEIKVAGNTTQGLVPYIEQLGFFEGGGVINEYRVDPVLLVAILSGKCTKEVIELCKQKQEILLQEPQQELKTCQERLDVCQQELLKPDANKQNLQEEIQWVQSRIGFVQSRIEKQKEESQKYINKLESIK